jgi:hypothetical protein
MFFSFSSLISEDTGRSSFNCYLIYCLIYLRQIFNCKSQLKLPMKLPKLYKDMQTICVVEAKSESKLQYPCCVTLICH